MEELSALRRVGDEIVEVADAVIHCKTQHNEQGIMDNIHSIAQLLLDYKRLNRATHRSLDDTRQTVVASKKRCDAQHLRLQNLLYEQAYLMREIQRCRDFQTDEMTAISNEIGEQLVADEYSEQLPSIHSHALEALSQELQARKSMQTEMDSVRKRRDMIQQSIEEKAKFLNELPSQLLAIEQAVAPLQSQFQIEVAAQATKDTAAQALPFPLYTLYKQLEGFKEANHMASLHTDVVQAKPLFGGFTAVDHAAKRQRTEAADDASLELNSQWKPANLALQLKMSVSAKCVVQRGVQVKEAEAQLLFQYVPSINAVVVEVLNHTLPANTPFSSSPLLLRLYPGDTGVKLPNPAALFHENAHEYPATAVARPFMWAQWICGLRSFADKLDQDDSYLRVKSVTAVIHRLRARLSTLVRLHHQLELFEKKIAPLPIHPALAQLLPDAAVAEVAVKSWAVQEMQAQDSFAFANDADFDGSDTTGLMVHRSAAERDGCVYYKIGLCRQRPTVVNLKVIVEVPPDYPLRPPLFLLQARNGPIDNHLKMVEAQLNADWHQFLSIPTPKAYNTAVSGDTQDIGQDTSLLVDMLISHQMRALQTLFAAFSSSVNGEQEAMSSLLMRPPRRGRNRHRASASLLIYSRFPEDTQR